jgi:hypothetical protein
MAPVALVVLVADVLGGVVLTEEVKATVATEELEVVVVALSAGLFFEQPVAVNKQMATRMIATDVATTFVNSISTSLNLLPGSGNNLGNVIKTVRSYLIMNILALTIGQGNI